MSWRRAARKALPYLLTLGIILLLLTQIDPGEIIRLLLHIQPAWLLAGWGFYLATNVARAFRFGVLLDLRRPWQILPEMLALSLFNNTLPSRSGELTFPYFMYKWHGMSVGESAAALILARIFDYLAVALLFLVFAIWQLPNLTPRAIPVIRITAGLLAISVLILALMPWVGQWGLRALAWLVRRLGWGEKAWVQRILRGGARMIATFQRLRRVKIYLLTLGWSLVNWLGMFAWVTAFLYAMGVPYPYPFVIIGATFASLAKALPFFTVSGFGAHEAGWAMGFGLTGMPLGQAIATGFAVNILTLFSSLLFGGMALIFMYKIRPRLAQKSVA